MLQASNLSFSYQDVSNYRYYVPEIEETALQVLFFSFALYQFQEWDIREGNLSELQREFRTDARTKMHLV